jgi:GTP-binding protein
LSAVCVYNTGVSKTVPIVAIVGRANVGKSSLFNAIIGRREAIIADEPGTTRDSVTAKASVNGKDFWLVDTAGLKSADDEFELSIQEQIVQAASDAQVIMVAVESNTQITEEDRRVATMALKSRKPVILVVNKIDKIRRFNLPDWQKLGIKQIVPTSVSQKKGLDELTELLSDQLPKAHIGESSDRIRVSLLGRPNVGKSSLFNAMAHKQQALVSSKAGTTRDINRLIIRYEGREIEIADTAGIRRPGRIERGVEQFSVMRSLAAIEQSDICLVLMDSEELNVQLDQKIAGLVKEAGKGLVLVATKWDIVEKDAHTRDIMAGQISENFVFVPWAPLIFTSAVSGQNVTKLFELIMEIDQARQVRIKTTELNKWLSETINLHPPAGLKNRTPKLNYMVQEDNTDLPSYKIFGAHTKFLHWSYKRYMERLFRERWPYAGTPIKFWFIEKH